MRLVTLTRQGIDYERAKEIFEEKNIFSLWHWNRYYEWSSTRFTDEEASSTGSIVPWTQEQLTGPCPFHEGKRVNETHFLFLGLNRLDGSPLTIKHLHERHRSPSQPYFFTYKQPLYPLSEFETKATCRFRWYLMPLQAVPTSFGKAYGDQLTLLPNAYEVPRVVEEVLKLIVYYIHNGVYLNSDCYARCSEVQPLDGKQVHVGDFDFHGLNVGFSSPVARAPFIGLAASRKPFM